MTTSDLAPVTVIGTGAMGSALASTLVAAGHPTTVWNRTPARTQPLVAAGATAAPDARSAVSSAPLVVLCLLRQHTVHEVLAPHADALAGRTIVNTTTTTPTQAREMATWLADHGADHVDAGILASPDMIGLPGAQILFSGSQAGFDANRPTLEVWGETAFVQQDHGAASLTDLAILAGMYTMFAGFYHGAAMVRSVGMSAADFASRSAPFLSAMTTTLAESATKVDDADFTEPGEQTLDFNDLTHMIQASRDAGVEPLVIDAVQTLIRRQVDAGHGADSFARIIESYALDARSAA